MCKPALALTLFLIIVSFLSAAQATKPAPKTAYNPVPIKAAREPNPVKSTAESIAEGKKIYGYDCAQCRCCQGSEDPRPHRSRASQNPHRRRTLLYHQEWSP